MKDKNKVLNELAKEIMLKMLENSHYWDLHSSHPEVLVNKSFLFAEAFIDQCVDNDPNFYEED